VLTPRQGKTRRTAFPGRSGGFGKAELPRLLPAALMRNAAKTGPSTICSHQQSRFEQADGGTLFLDEIANMSLAFQEKVLRVVEYGTFTRVGGTEELRTTARIIAATNRDLREAIREGRFLADLYDRLAFETLEVPPLRRRPGDIPVLAQFFLDQLARKVPRFAGERLSRAASELLKRSVAKGDRHRRRQAQL